jgi:hypothetical protein
MAISRGERVGRPGERPARALLRGDRRLGATLARRVGTLGGDVSSVVRERPSLTFAPLALALGTILASWQVSSFPRRRTMRQRLRHGRRQLGGALGLPSLAVKLLANPIVRGYLHRTMLREVARRLGR